MIESENPTDLAIAAGEKLGQVPAGAKGPRASIYWMFFCSGLASLICEVVWFKQLQLLLGSSTLAVSVVVACFFGGLACGSWLGGKLADRGRRLLRLYGMLELLLGILSTVTTLVLSRWTQWGELLGPWLAPDSPAALPLMALLSLAILLAPTALMGATLPVLARHLVRRHSELARRIGFLYGLNTLGAATGCVLVGFVLIGLVGVIQSALIAATIYSTIGFIALFLSRSGSEVEPAAFLLEERAESADVAAPTSARSAKVLIAVFALSGFSSIAYEVLWFRVLKCFSLPFVYVFSGMLSTYLIGLVLGSLICARWLAGQKDRLLTYFAAVQLGTSVAGMVSLAALGQAGRIWLKILYVIHNVQDSLGGRDIGFSGVVPVLVLSAIVVLFPTTILGIGFPLASELAVQKLSRLGSWVGTLYSLNTLGGVLGSLVTGFVLLPVVGSYWSFVCIIGLNLGLFFLLVATQPPLRRNSALRCVGALAVSCLIFCFVYLGADYLREAQIKVMAGEVLAFRESRDATYVVLTFDNPVARKAQQLVVNGTSYANNFPPGRRYMSTLGHLPALLHPAPRSVVVIAIGTGTTVGSLTLNPAIDRLWAVDISRDVFELAPYFVPLNHQFMKSPKVRPVVADGRHFLLCTEEKFDVMTFEPPPPQEAGVVNLYSQDFYQLAKRRLAPGGILCQWVPLDLSHEVLGRMLLRTLQAEFPYVSLWIPARYEGVVLASMSPLAVDLDRLQKRMAEPGMRADMSAYGLGKPEQLLATFVTADEGLAAFTGDVPPITDNHPWTEYFLFFPRGAARFDQILAHRRPVQEYVFGSRLEGHTLEREKEVMFHLWYGYELERDGHYSAALARINQALQLDPDNPYLQYRSAYLERRLLSQRP